MVKSTLAAETLAAVEAVEAGFLLTSILKELHNSQSSIDIECFTDNQSLFYLTQKLGLMDCLLLFFF